MKILRAAEASVYLDGLTDDCERSSALAVHLTWLDYYSSLADSANRNLDTTLDMLLLYQAAVRAFCDNAVDNSVFTVANSKYINLNQSIQILEKLTDQKISQYAHRFISEIVRLSDGYSREQDFIILIDLFLKCLERCPISNILNGEVSKSSRRLADCDNW
jgi:hypothetical protein